MEIFPELQMGFLNGWLPLVLYLVGFLISIALFTKESRIWLFNNPKTDKIGAARLLRLFGQLAMVVFILLMIASPLRIDRPVFLIGAVVYAVGYLFVMSALHYFRLTPVNQPVMNGPYRISRNPQWVGLFLVLLGSALATGVWLYIGVVLMVGMIYHIQIIDEEKTCKAKYGESYCDYMKRVPRYLLIG